MLPSVAIQRPSFHVINRTTRTSNGESLTTIRCPMHAVPLVVATLKMTPMVSGCAPHFESVIGSTDRMPVMDDVLP